MIKKNLISIISLIIFAYMPNIVFSATQISEISLKANLFLDSLNESQVNAAKIPFNSNERSQWTNLPNIMMHPAGLLIKDMNQESRKAFHKLMRATLSSQGYSKITGVMLLDDLLQEIEMQDWQANKERNDFVKTFSKPMAKAFILTRDYENYSVAVFGEPNDPSWGWRISGHHLAANFTLTDGKIAFTPTFLGSNPMEVQNGRYAGFMALANEGAKGIELMKSLNRAQLKKATTSNKVAKDIFEGVGRRKSIQKYEGIKATDLTKKQNLLLENLITEFTNNAKNEAAVSQLNLIKDDWDKLWFSWHGPVDADSRFYYRIHGPRVLIEYNRVDENHDHMIIRDPSNDYGEDWLGKHYEEYHPNIKEVIKDTKERAAQMTNKK